MYIQDGTGSPHPRQVLPRLGRMELRSDPLGDLLARGDTMERSVSNRDSRLSPSRGEARLPRAMSAGGLPRDDVKLGGTTTRQAHFLQHLPETTKGTVL